MKKKRILSLLLTLALLTTLLPSALAVSVSDFTDVSEDDWYYEYVDFVTDKGYFVGTSGTTFSPNDTMTRAMFALVLARIDEAELDNSVTSFSDVPVDEWYTGAVTWASENGIVAGIGNNQFDPNGEITREQMCVMMDRFIDYYGEKTNQTHEQEGSTDPFPDNDKVSDYAKDAVVSCRAYGLINGFPDGNFHPQEDSTRAEVATVVSRLAWLVKPDDQGGGGGGGGGGGPVGPTATSYTITFMNGTVSVGTVTTESNTSAEKSFTTLAAPVQEGDVFVNWNTAADGSGAAYAASTEYTATGNMTLYAQWINDEDYIGKAVMAAMEQFNEDYLGYGNVSYSGSSVSVDAVAFNSYIDPDDTRKQTVTASAAVSEDLVVEMIETAASTAMAWMGNDNPLEDDVTSAVDGIVDAFEEITGITISGQTVQQIKDQVYDKVASAGKSLWANFYDANGYYTGDVTIEAGSATVTVKVDQTNHTTTLGGSRRDAVVSIGSALAREMYASMTGNTEYTNEVQLTGTLTFTFDDGTVYGSATQAYPHVYPIEIGLTLDGGELVEYKFDGQSYVKLNITQSIQDSYEEQLDAVIRDALSTDTVKNELRDRIDATVETFSNNSTFDALANAMVKVGAAEDEDAAQKIIQSAMSAWQTANMDIDSLADSPLFKLYWEQDPTASFNNIAIYNLVETVSDAAAVLVNSEMDKVADGNGMIQAMVDAAKKTANPDDIEDVLLDDQYNIDISAILALNDYPELKDYALAVISDYLNARIPGNTDHNYTEAAAPAMRAEMDSLVTDAVEGTNYYDYLQKAIKIQHVDTMADIQLGNLATLLRNETFLNYVDGRGSSVIDRVTNLIGRLPEGASVELNGVTLNKAALEDIQEADTAREACEALADLIDQNGLKTLTLNSFAGDGMEITVQYNSRTFSFHLVIDIA